MNDINLSNKIALITGSTRGIGLATAQLLAQQGAHVFINGRNSDEVAKVTREYREQGLNFEGMAGDVSDEKFVKKIISFAARETGRIDILVNNAGISEKRMLEEITEERWDAFLDNNLKSSFLMCKEAAPIMKKNKRGKIINISSIAGIIGRIGGAHYAASKGGLIGFTKTIAKELGPSNIQVNAIAPAITDTDLSRKVSAEYSIFFKKVAQGTPLGRIASPNDIAKTILFFSSSLSDFITGQVLIVGGGSELMYFDI